MCHEIHRSVLFIKEFMGNSQSVVERFKFRLVSKNAVLRVCNILRKMVVHLENHSFHSWPNVRC